MNIGLIKLYYSVYKYDIAKVAQLTGEAETTIRIAVESHGLVQETAETEREILESQIQDATLVKDHHLLPHYAKVEEGLLEAITVSLGTLDHENPNTPAAIDKLAKAFAALRGSVIKDLSTGQAGGNVVVQILNSI